MTFRNLALCLTLIAFAFAATPAKAEQTIAVVDIAKIMKEAKAANSVKDQVEAKQKSYQAEANKKEKELQDANQELAKQRSILSQEAFEDKLIEFRKTVSTAQREDQKKRIDLNKAQAQAVDTIQNTVGEIVTEIAKEKSISVVMPNIPLLYYKPEMDITAEVLGRLDKKLPKVTVNF